MIEIVTDKERNLKNLKQIGTPREENKIYIENLAYSKLKEDIYREKRVYVLMGHTERMEGHYATFVEAVIPVVEAEFAGSVPQWSNVMWSQVFREIKRVYEDMIIVGWAVDVRGMLPSLTPELERTHREYFGGVHQVLLLMDTLEQEECFYIYKENRLVPKDGFYIYYRARKHVQKQEFKVLDLNRETDADEKVSATVQLDPAVTGAGIRERGSYRQMLQQQKEAPESTGGAGLAIAVAMLVFIIAVGAYENRDAIPGIQKEPSTQVMQEQESEQASETETDVEANAPGYTIPVE